MPPTILLANFMWVRFGWPKIRDLNSIEIGGILNYSMPSLLFRMFSHYEGQLYLNDRPFLFYQKNTLNCAFVEFNLLYP